MMLVVHLLVDTRDAMGANLVNSMCEGVASLIEKITGGKVFLRILSNLADRALARAEVTLPVAHLAGKGYAGERVRDGIIIATDFADVDPYRAATHNKGIMNGIDAVALATGNDWRAIEAGAHAYAARRGRYSSLTTWWKDDDGNLRRQHRDAAEGRHRRRTARVAIPACAINLRLLGVDRATELAEVMAAVGLAQNFAALRALATDGIQHGPHDAARAQRRDGRRRDGGALRRGGRALLQSGEIKVWKAQQIVAKSCRPRQRDRSRRAPPARGRRGRRATAR